MKSEVYNQKGESVGHVELSRRVFGASWKEDLVHKVVTSMMSNARHSNAHVKDRSAVRGGGKKPWRQKGTGRARHGSSRSPIWVGGGVAHGPSNEKSYSKKINKKEKISALYSVLSKKFKDGEVLFVESFDFKEPKTKEAKLVLNSLSKISGFEKINSKKKNAALIALDKRDDNTEKSFRNFGCLTIDEIRNINPVTLLQYKYLIVLNPKVSLEKIPGQLK